MKTSLIACAAGVNNSGERERGQHAHAPRVPEIPLPLLPSHFYQFIDNQYKF